MWHVKGEGVWAVSLNHDPVPLPVYWAANIKPEIDASEAKWKAIHRHKHRRDSSPDCPTPRVVRSPSFDDQLVSCRELRPEFDRRSASSIPSGGATDGALISLHPDTDTRTPLDRKDDHAESSELQEELHNVADDLGDADPDPAVSTPNGGTTEKEENALAGKPTRPLPAPINGANPAASRHSWRGTVEEQDDLDRLEVERGWLSAVDILIQMADCLLVSLSVSGVLAMTKKVIVQAFHERRLALVVCRPEYFAIYPKAFKAKSSAALGDYPVSLDLVRTSAIVPLSGYQGGKVVNGMSGDFDGDRVLSTGPGAGTFLQPSPLSDEGDGADEAGPAGALEGTFDEEAIRYVNQQNTSHVNLITLNTQTTFALSSPRNDFGRQEAYWKHGGCVLLGRCRI